MLISGEKMLASAELKSVPRDLYVFWIFFRWGTTVTRFFIVGYVWQISYPPIREQPRKGPSWKACSNPEYKFIFCEVSVRAEISTSHFSYHYVTRLCEYIDMIRNNWLIIWYDIVICILRIVEVILFSTY